MMNYHTKSGIKKLFMLAFFQAKKFTAKHNNAAYVSGLLFILFYVTKSYIKYKTNITNSKKPSIS